MKGFIKTAAIVATPYLRCMFTYTTIAERDDYAQPNGMQIV